ncbi:hypothetical protein [Nocardia seriolae]|uniref:hypothetical protein n=1 Tax=Nocardia seriolae TaxID=37332 RepID=UPI001392497F|nr:hypothetical protein [Nocardia seriolae]QOW37794.1 hypothetical protein IMZ23_22835 [Nocardia seriolae]QUN22009.1 hypothetical protein KEC46_22070 [Nocardia seriolae]WNJ63293.1 hypothetical protein RMO66_31735 [Nocardia seriolae]
MQHRAIGQQRGVILHGRPARAIGVRANGRSIVPFTTGRPYAVAARIAKLRPNIAAVFLIGLNATESAAAQSITAATAGRLVISETGTLTAAAVTRLRAKST